MNVMRHTLEKNAGSDASDDNNGSMEDTIQPLNENAFHLSTGFLRKNDTRPHVSGSAKKVSRLLLRLIEFLLSPKSMLLIYYACPVGIIEGSIILVGSHVVLKVNIISTSF